MRGHPLLIVLVVSAALAAGTPAAGSTSRKANPGSPQLRMEEIEVHGFRDRPERLYLPAPAAPRVRSPLPLDLLREDMENPFLPGEVVEELPSGGAK
jgi:hypothetical protein